MGAFGIGVLMLTGGVSVKMGIPLYVNMKLGGGIPPRRYGVSLPSTREAIKVGLSA